VIPSESSSMSAKVLRPVCDSREQAAPCQPSNSALSALSGSDRHDFAVSQGLDIANWGLAKESPVLAIELARALVADLERRTRRIQFTREHALPRGMQAKLLLKLQRTHRSRARKWWCSVDRLMPAIVARCSTRRASRSLNATRQPPSPSGGTWSRAWQSREGVPPDFPAVSEK
jgi:hypothetical protein